jgi:hypothetical protein
MDESNGLARDYILTIESMRNEIDSLKAQLEVLGGVDGDEADYPVLQEELENDYQEIESLYSDITDANFKIIQLKSEEEWIQSEYPS